MSTGGHTEQTEQRILNDAKDALYNTIDTTPFVETTQGSVAARVTGTASGSKVAMDVAVGSSGSSGGQVDAHPVQSDGTTLVLTTGGQTGMKVMVVGDSDKYMAACSPYFNNALSTTVQTVKASAGTLVFFEASNANTSDAFLQVFDVSGTVTLGTTTPTQSYLLPAGASSTLRGGVERVFVGPVNFANAIKIAATTTPTGNTAPSTALTVNIGYF